MGISRTAVAFTVVIAAGLGLFVWNIFKNPPDPTLLNVHWHAKLSYNLCGDTAFLPDTEAGHISRLHGHNDGKIHYEPSGGRHVKGLNRIGEYFDSNEIPFDRDKIEKWKTGDQCPGSDKPGKVWMKVNGEFNEQFRDYEMKDGDEIKVIFGDEKTANELEVVEVKI